MIIPTTLQRQPCKPHLCCHNVDTGRRSDAKVCIGDRRFQVVNSREYHHTESSITVASVQALSLNRDRYQEEGGGTCTGGR